MVIEITGLEGGKILIIERIRRGGACLDDVALVQTEFDFAGHVFLGGLDESLLRFTQRGEPLAFVNKAGELVADLILHLIGGAVQDQLFQLLVGFHQDGAAGSLINASGLHADNTVLNDVNDADAVLAAQLVELADDVGNAHGFAVEGLGNALLEGHGHIGDFIGSLLGCYAQDQQVVIVGHEGRIFQLQAFVADVPEVPVTAVAAVSGEGQVDAVLLTVFDLGLTGIQCPLVVPPGGDDLEIGGQGLDAQLETDLVIALAGGAVADGGGVFLTGDLDQLLGDQRTCHRGAQQVFVLIDGVCLYAGNDIFIREFLSDIQDVQLGSAAVFCSFFQAVQLFFLAAVDADTDDFVAEVLFEPGDDRGRIKAAGIGKDYFFFCIRHFIYLRLIVCYSLCCFLLPRSRSCEAVPSFPFEEVSGKISLKAAVLQYFKSVLTGVRRAPPFADVPTIQQSKMKCKHYFA